MPERILVVGDFNRSDFLFAAKQFRKEAKFYFIEFLNKKNLINKECLEYGVVLYWKDFNDAYDLLNKIKPTKVLFYFIESYNHVALNVACKVKSIQTFHLEHGVRFSLSYYKLINKSRTEIKKKGNHLRKISLLVDALDKYRNRRFFFNTKLKSPIKEATFLSEYYKVRSSNSIFDTFQLLRNNLRLPDHYISFSPVIFNYHKELENLPATFPVSFIGIPQFDTFIQWKELEITGENILFIDQPLHEQQLYGWNQKGKETFLKALVHVSGVLNKKLFIKPHPLNDQNIYKGLLEHNVSIIINEWQIVVPDVNIVLGFSSTLLLPFMAMDHITCFTLEIHPHKTEVPYSQFLLESKACNSVNNLDELAYKLSELYIWHSKQKEAKMQFIKNYMYKFDGKSSERLKNILLGETA